MNRIASFSMQAYYPGDLPPVTGVAPDDDELIRLGEMVLFLVIDEAVQGDLHGAVAGNGIDLDAPFDEYPGLRIAFNSVCLLVSSPPLSW
jgi:hypothetical protein